MLKDPSFRRILICLLSSHQLKVLEKTVTEAPQWRCCLRILFYGDVFKDMVDAVFDTEQTQLLPFLN